MICWCTGPVTRRFGTVRWALIASVGCHAALAWYLLGSAARPAPLGKLPATPWVSPPRLQIVMLPTPPAPPAPAQPAPLAPAVPRGAEQNAKPTGRARSDATTSPALPALRQPSSWGAESPSTSAHQSAAAVTPAPSGSGAKLNLDLQAALQAAERLRSKSPLAAAVDAQHAQNARSTTARAFSVLDTPSSSIVSETVMSDGTRLVKFSGGGCMRMPNPAARSFDDVRKPSMESC